METLEVGDYEFKIGIDGKLTLEGHSPYEGGPDPHDLTVPQVRRLAGMCDQILRAAGPTFRERCDAVLGAGIDSGHHAAQLFITCTEPHVCKDLQLGGMLSTYQLAKLVERCWDANCMPSELEE